MPSDEVDDYLRKTDRELRTGLLSLMVLAVMKKGGEEQYGYQIIQHLKELTDGGLIVPEGTIYPILHSLHEHGLLRSRWRVSDSGPPRRYYRLTQEGVAVLRQGLDLWESLRGYANIVFGFREGSP